jgi:hypothetical protein
MAFARMMISRSSAGSRLRPPLLGAARTHFPKPRKSLKASHVFWEQKFFSTLPRAEETEARHPLGTWSRTPLLSPRMVELLGVRRGSGAKRGVPATGLEGLEVNISLRHHGQCVVDLPIRRRHPSHIRLPMEDSQPSSGATPRLWMWMVSTWVRTASSEVKGIAHPNGHKMVSWVSIRRLFLPPRCACCGDGAGLLVCLMDPSRGRRGR